VDFTYLPVHLMGEAHFYGNLLFSVNSVFSVA